MSNFALSNATFDPDQTELFFNDDKPQIDVKFTKAGFDLDFDYHVFTDPELLDDLGKGKAWMRNLKLALSFTPIVKNGMV